MSKPAGPDGPHDPHSTHALALAISQSMHTLAYATRDREGVGGPAAVYALLAELATATSGMGQVARHLDGHLSTLLDEGVLVVDNGSDADLFHRRTRWHEAAVTADQAAAALSRALQAMHNTISDVQGQP